MDKPKTAGDWLIAITIEFGKESDRASAIVAAAMLDEALAVLLRNRLVPAYCKERTVLDRYDAPLGHFSDRIDAAFQLGLISKYLARDLHLIRKIRNEFAHRPLECTFEDEKIKNLVAVLEKASDYNTRNRQTRESIGPPGTRWDFLGIAGWILFSLHSEIPKVQKLSEHSPEFGYIEWDKLPAELLSRLRAIDST